MIAAGPAAAFDTVILAGGKASRLGGADKAGLAVGAAPMLVSVARAAAAAGTSQLIVVGPARAGPVQDGLTKLAAGRTGWLTLVQEQPPCSGPVAGLRRGLREVTAMSLVLLAADLPFLTAAHIRHLGPAGQVANGAAAGDGETRGPPIAFGVVSTDDMGRPQWLTSCWPTALLRTALTTYAGDSLQGLLAPLRPATIRLNTAAGAAPPWLDCDTPDDLATARRTWTEREEDPGG